MTKSLSWTPDLSVGNGHLDAQHARLFQLTHEATSLLESGDGDSDKTYEVLNDITEALLKHFADEEQVLAHNGCRLLDVHKAAHLTIQLSLLEILSRAIESRLDKRALVLLMTDWIDGHVQEMDMLCKKHMKKTSR